MSIINSLGWVGWTILALIPPAIILLYFLKLKRQPLEVPSTFLWQRAIEDLHVNSLWQRLRRNWLLVLQLLLLALIVIALLRPGWKGVELTGNRFIFLVDNSASMSATDEGQTRLELARQRCHDLIDQMDDGDQAMIISFSDRYTTEVGYTSNRSKLRRALDRIEPTNRTSDLSVALRAAAGLANPGRASQEGTNDIQVADPVPASLYIFSDGRFDSPTDFALGNLSPTFVSLGSQQADNVGVVSFAVDHNPDAPNKLQAYARIENFGDDDAELIVALYLDDEFRDFETITVGKMTDDEPGSRGVEFYLVGPDVSSLQGSILTIELKDADGFSPDGADESLEVGTAVHQDHLPLDNIAHTVINMPRQASVLVVTQANDALELALATSQSQKLAKHEFAKPGYLETSAYQAAAAEGKYDLIIFDRCAPKAMPQANTFFIGSMPPAETWTREETKGPPVILDMDLEHPVMQLLLEARTIWIAEGFAVNGPPGSLSLIDANIGSLLTIGPRAGFQDAVMGFGLVTANEEGGLDVNTDWPRRYSFPVFVHNAVTHLGGSRGLFATPNVKPGRSLTLRSNTAAEELRISPPTGDPLSATRQPPNAYVFGETDQPGVYEVREGTADDVAQRFAVNLFDSQESNITPRDFSIGHQEIKGVSGWQPARKELWKWILLLGLGVLIFEWYIFNKRVHL